MLKHIRSTPGYFVLIPINDYSIGQAILSSSGLVGSVVEGDTHLNDVATAHIVYTKAQVA